MGQTEPKVIADWIIGSIQVDPQARVFMDALPVGLSWARIEDNRIQFMNRAFTEMFGYTLEDFNTGWEWIDVAVVDSAEMRKRVEEFWRAYFAEPKQVVTPNVELEVRCKDGTIKTVLQGLVVLPDTNCIIVTYVDISEQKKNEELIRRLSLEDPLTGLANRRAFEETLERFVARFTHDRTNLALLALDLDRFKGVNDRHGHDIGDALLRAVAGRIKRAVRPGDSLARVGGDEFSVILPGVADIEQVEAVCSRIIDTLELPFELAGLEISIGTSIGIGMSPPASDKDTIYQDADRAIYRAKRAGRGRWSR